MHPSGTRTSEVRPYGTIVLAGIGLVFFLIVWMKVDRAGVCQSDFGAFYTGGALAFSNQLYSAEAAKRLQHDILGCNGDQFGQFIRLPYFAALFWPVAKLPFSVALILWRALCSAALIAFIWLWPGPRWRTLCVCVWSLPMLAAFAYGQDVPILLWIVALSFLLLARGHDAKAGLLLSLGAAKPHLFAIQVALIFVRRFWRTAIGICAGGALLLAGCFMTAGASWPLTFWRTVTDPDSNPHPETMINLHGLVVYFHAPAWVEGVLAVVIFGLIWRACLDLPAPACWALALAAGVLLGMHSYVYDLVLCIPLILIVLDGRAYPYWLKALAAIFASPIGYVLPSALPIWSFILLLFLILTSAVASIPHLRSMDLSTINRPGSPTRALDHI
jgi:hypothetical protein